MLDMVDTETVMNAAGTMGTLVGLEFIHPYILWQDYIFCNSLFKIFGPNYDVLVLK